MLTLSQSRGKAVLYPACYLLQVTRRMVSFLLILTLVSVSFAKDTNAAPGPIHLDRDGEKWAERTLHKLSLEEKSANSS